MQQFVQGWNVRFVVFQVFYYCVVVLFDGCFDYFIMLFVSYVLKFGMDWVFFLRCIKIFIGVDLFLYGYEVNQIFQIGFSIDWNVNWYSVCIGMVFDYVNVVEEVCVDFVYFVNEYDMWNFVVISLMLNGFSLRFNVSVCVKNVNSIIENCQ